MKIEDRRTMEPTKLTAQDIEPGSVFESPRYHGLWILSDGKLVMTNLETGVGYDVREGDEVQLVSATLVIEDDPR